MKQELKPSDSEKNSLTDCVLSSWRQPLNCPENFVMQIKHKQTQIHTWPLYTNTYMAGITCQAPGGNHQTVLPRKVCNTMQIKHKHVKHKHAKHKTCKTQSTQHAKHIHNTNICKTQTHTNHKTCKPQNMQKTNIQNTTHAKHKTCKTQNIQNKKTYKTQTNAMLQIMHTAHFKYTPCQCPEQNIIKTLRLCLN